MGGEIPAGYHAVNLVLHLIAILLLWDALGRFVSPAARLIATAIFAVHPFQAEPVNYIYARSALLATVLCLASLRSWSRGNRWWAVVWFGCALLAKEECVAFPAFLVLLSLPISAKSKELPPIAAMFALSLAAGLRVLFAVQTTAGSGAGAHAGVTWQSYLMAEGLAILRYFRMLLLPWGFTVDADFPIRAPWLGALAWLTVLGLALLAWRTRHRSRSGIWFLGGLLLLLPSSSIFPANDLAADYRMYLPMLGFAICLGIILERVKLIYLAPVFVILIFLSFVRTETWKTEESLWADAVEKAPSKIRPRIQLARAVEPARALDILEQAKQIAPDDPQIPSEEGRIYLSEGKPAQALVEFGRTLALTPRSADALNNRGAALLALNQKDVAIQDFERALALDPCQFNALSNLQRLGVAISTPSGCKFTKAQKDALGVPLR
ncbi:MAG TPA: tetratricopeptide repeat protein [Bryobacteraceae bacterium]|nr:tetratricopeptide repeat protein [Bryobacteraceae bacterium]